MKDSTRTPMGRSTGWLAITGSLVCLAGCAGPLTHEPVRCASTAIDCHDRVTIAHAVTAIHVAAARDLQATDPRGTAIFRSAPPHTPDRTTPATVKATSPRPAAASPVAASPVAPDQWQPSPTSLGNSPATRRHLATTSLRRPARPCRRAATIRHPWHRRLPGSAPRDPYAPVLPYANYQPGPRVREADLVINGFPARTGRIMLGGAVNSDAGVTGQLTIDERNFDISRWPRSFRDLFSGTAFRGAGQTFRVEAAPGTNFQRYTVQFADPNIFGYKPVSMSVSGFLYDRRFTDWDEQRLGGRLAFGYRVTPDLSVSAGVSGQSVDITNPRVLGVPATR